MDKCNDEGNPPFRDPVSFLVWKVIALVSVGLCALSLAALFLSGCHFHVDPPQGYPPPPMDR